MSVGQASASTAYDVAPERPARESTRPCGGQFKDIRRSHWTAPTDPNRDTRMSKADFGDKGCLRKINRRFLGNPPKCHWPRAHSMLLANAGFTDSVPAFRKHPWRLPRGARGKVARTGRRQSARLPSTCLRAELPPGALQQRVPRKAQTASFSRWNLQAVSQDLQTPLTRTHCGDGQGA